MTSHHASGSFAVTMQPQPGSESAPGAKLGRMDIRVTQGQRFCELGYSLP